jgi:hypothetical protein
MVQVAPGLPGRRQRTRYCSMWSERVPSVFHGTKGAVASPVGPRSWTDFTPS